MPVAEEKYFDLKIISPNRIFYQGKASMVELNTLEGTSGADYLHKERFHHFGTGRLRACG